MWTQETLISCVFLTMIIVMTLKNAIPWKKKDKKNDHQKLPSLVHEKYEHDMKEVYTHDNLPEII